MEFEYALETGKPIISFLPKKPDDIPSGKCEKDPDKQKKLEEFKELAQKKLVKYWENPEQLGSIVSRSMIKLIKDFPAEGWVRAGSAVDEKSVKEIARLQKENALLQERLNAIAFEAPKGSEVLAQGDDEFTATFTFEAWHARKGKYFTIRQDYVCTWNDIFVAVAPELINEGSHRKMQHTLNTFISENALDEFEKATKEGYSNFSNIEIDDSAYNRIKVQFRALGLICLSDKKRQVSDKGTYWKLTPYGDNVMTQLLAIRK
jgi:hypothetical protein